MFVLRPSLKIIRFICIFCVIVTCDRAAKCSLGYKESLRVAMKTIACSIEDYTSIHDRKNLFYRFA